MERGIPCTVITIGEHSIDVENLTRLDSSTKYSGGWLEKGDNKLAKY